MRPRPVCLPSPVPLLTPIPLHVPTPSLLCFCFLMPVLLSVSADLSFDCSAPLPPMIRPPFFLFLCISLYPLPTNATWHSPGGRGMHSRLAGEALLLRVQGPAVPPPRPMDFQHRRPRPGFRNGVAIPARMSYLGCAPIHTRLGACLSTARHRQSWVIWKQRDPSPLPGLGTQGHKPSFWTATLSDRLLPCPAHCLRHLVTRSLSSFFVAASRA